MKLSVFALSCSVFAFACSVTSTEAPSPGSGDGAGAPGSGDTPGSGSPAPCADGDVAFSLTAPSVDFGAGYTQIATHQVLGVVLGAGATGPSVLVGQLQADKSEKLSFVDANGSAAAIDVASVAGVVASNGGTYTVAAAPFVLNGKRCAAFVKDGDTLKLACEGVAVEDSGITNIDGDKPLHPTVLADGSLALFGSAFAAYHEVDRTAQGQWRDVEKYESSISWAEDAVVHDGQPIACYIDDAGFAVLDAGGQDHGAVSSTKASHCRIAAGDASLFVLTDDAYAAVPWANVSASSFTPVKGALTLAASDRVLALVTPPDAAFAVVDRGTKLEAVPLSAGAPVALGPGDVKAAAWDASAGALRFVTVTTDSTSGLESFTVSTRCSASLTH